MKIHGTIEALYSKRDVNGNCYWAMRYTDNETGTVVEATTVGGESNIHGIRMGFSKPREWDAGIRASCVQLGIREFNRTTKDWPHAGCCSEDLQAYIKETIGKKRTDWPRICANLVRALTIAIDRGDDVDTFGDQHNDVMGWMGIAEKAIAKAKK